MQIDGFIVLANAVRLFIFTNLDSFINSTFLFKFTELILNLSNKLRSCTADSFKRGFQFGSVLTGPPRSNISKAIIRCINAEMLTNGICNTFSFNFLSASILWRTINIRFLQISVVKLCVCNFVNSSLYRLDFGHTLFYGYVLIFLVIKAFCRAFNFCELNRNRGNFLEDSKKLFKVLNIAFQLINTECREFFSVCLTYIKHGNHLKCRNCDFDFLHNRIAVLIKYRLICIRV